MVLARGAEERQGLISFVDLFVGLRMLARLYRSECRSLEVDRLTFIIVLLRVCCLASRTCVEDGDGWDLKKIKNEQVCIIILGLCVCVCVCARVGA